MHESLHNINYFDIDINSDNAPMVYPFWNKNMAIQQKLIKIKIFVATYWNNVLKWCDVNTLEYQLVKGIVFRPIDQRYTTKEMDLILKLILNA